MTKNFELYCLNLSVLLDGALLRKKLLTNCQGNTLFKYVKGEVILDSYDNFSPQQCLGPLDCSLSRCTGSSADSREVQKEQDWECPITRWRSVVRVIDFLKNLIISNFINDMLLTSPGKARKMRFLGKLVEDTNSDSCSCLWGPNFKSFDGKSYRFDTLFSWLKVWTNQTSVQKD